MREINRRTDIGVRWSIPGVRNLRRLTLAKRHNPDDYAAVWEEKRPIHWQLVPQVARCQEKNLLPTRYSLSPAPPTTDISPSSVREHITYSARSGR